MLGSVTQACRTLLSGDENVRKCCLSVPRYTLGRRKVWVSLPKSPIHPYVILPCTFRQRKWAEVSPESVVLHPRATKRRDSVAQACRAALLGDENVRKCRLNVSCRTLGRRRSAEVSLKRVVPHSWATKMYGSVAQACRTLLSSNEKYGFRCRRVPFILTSFCLAPFGDENGLKCRLKVSCRTLGRRRSAKVLPKRAALHPLATESVGFVAEESPSSLRHSALHLSATKMG